MATPCEIKNQFQLQLQSWMITLTTHPIREHKSCAGRTEICQSEEGDLCILTIYFHSICILYVRLGYIYKFNVWWWMKLNRNLNTEAQQHAVSSKENIPRGWGGTLNIRLWNSIVNNVQSQPNIAIVLAWKWWNLMWWQFNSVLNCVKMK